MRSIFDPDLQRLLRAIHFRTEKMRVATVCAQLRIPKERYEDGLAAMRDAGRLEADLKNLTPLGYYLRDLYELGGIVFREGAHGGMGLEYARQNGWAKRVRVGPKGVPGWEITGKLDHLPKIVI